MGARYLVDRYYGRDGYTPEMEFVNDLNQRVGQRLVSHTAIPTAAGSAYVYYISVVWEFLRAPLSKCVRKTPAIDVATGSRGKQAPIQDAIIALIRRKPDATYNDLAVELYGNASQRANVAARVMVSKMKRQRRLAGKPGSWTVSKAVK